MIQRLNWQDITFIAGTGVKVTDCQYATDDMGFIHFRGYFILTPALTAPTTTVTLVNLPAGYRPTADRFATGFCITNTDRGIRWQLATGGNLNIAVVNTGTTILAGAFFTLDDLTFSL